jgi:hypothetical protein
MTMPLRHLLTRAAVTCFLFAGLAHAQDPFEIHVYEYETLHRGQFTFETHLNYVGKGTRTFEGPVAPFQDQLHMTFELTAGLTDYASLGFMQLNARRVGHTLDFAGWGWSPSSLFKTQPTRRTLGASNSVQSWKRALGTFRSTSIQYSSALCMDPEPAPVGTSNLPPGSATKSLSGLLQAWNITVGGGQCRHSCLYPSSSTKSFLVAMLSLEKTWCGVSVWEWARRQRATGLFTNRELKSRLGASSPFVSFYSPVAPENRPSGNYLDLELNPLILGDRVWVYS